jgi:hypothetical protein
MYLSRDDERFYRNLKWDISYCNTTLKQVGTRVRFPNCNQRGGEFIISSLNATYTLEPQYIEHYHWNQYYLSACTSVSRKECSLARKWVDHHLRNGVEHFTFYLNDNEDYWWNCLSNLERRGIVSLVNFTFPHHRQFYEQQAAMNSCGRRSRYTTRYLVQCDIDEFMVSFDPNYTLLDYVHE